jgi:hypothetical protein
MKTWGPFKIIKNFNMATASIKPRLGVEGYSSVAKHSAQHAKDPGFYPQHQKNMKEGRIEGRKRDRKKKKGSGDASKGRAV